MKLSTDRLASVEGFGMLNRADGYVFRPTALEEIPEIFDLARKSGRRVVLRGAGRSYGDASIREEALVLDLRRMDRVLDWDPATGVLKAEAGVTIEKLWRTGLEDGWWPPVVSGTMFPTLAGALAMNIHGKNAFKVGPLGEHVLELQIWSPGRGFETLTPADPAFFEVISSAGLLAVIVGATVQMKRVSSGDLTVLPISQPNWKSQFDTFERFESEADYLVSWVDIFGHGKGAGRGLIHAAWYTEGEGEHPVSLRMDRQDLPDSTLGVPKSAVWRALKKFNHRSGMRFVNGAKYASSRILGNERPHPQSLVAFSFLLDYVPNWRLAYQPHGFVQYQTFVPKEHARQVFAEQVELQQREKSEAFLGVLKRHRPDRFLFSHAVDGYSLALDFRANEPEKLMRLCHKMNDLVLQAGGRFYFAKDSTLRPSDVRSYLGVEALNRFRARKQEMDPEGLLTSALAERVGLT